MLRRTIAVLLLAAIGCGFYYWSYLKKDFTTSMDGLIDELSEQVSVGNTDEAQNTIDAMKDLYSSKEDTFNMFANHEFINSLSDYVVSIEASLKSGDVSLLNESLALLKNHVDGFYKDNKISLSNIF